MNEVVTIEALALGRNKEDLIDAVLVSLINEDIIIHSKTETSSDSILDSMPKEFKRRLVCLAVDSHNPLSRATVSILEDKLREVSESIVNGEEDKPF
jgi:hypothetical protein